MKTKVKVDKFRQATDHMYRIANQDFHACKGPTEIGNWHEGASRMLREYQQYTCPRAKDTDQASFDMSQAQLMARIETAATYIEHHQSNKKKVSSAPEPQAQSTHSVSEQRESNFAVHYIH